MRFRDWLGRYVMHCHNVIHEDHAMMLRFDVGTTGDTNRIRKPGRQQHATSVLLPQNRERSLKMSEVSRRKLFAGLAVAPFAAALAASGDEASAPAPAHKFAPRISGREMMRRRYFPDIELTPTTAER